MKKEKPIALIAGAGSRLGKSLINEFVERGYKVVAASRSEVSYSGAGDVSWKKLDITNHSDCKNVVESTISEHNGVDALVICSGYYPSVESFFDQSHEDIMLDIGIT